LQGPIPARHKQKRSLPIPGKRIASGADPLARLAQARGDAPLRPLRALYSHSKGARKSLALGGINPPGQPVAFDGNYASLPVAMLRPPIEGNRSIPMNILWVQDAMAPGYAIEFNAAARQTTPISQISALYVDNTNNHSNVVIVFNDTNFELVVAANTAGFFPVVTNGVRFFLWPKLAPNAQDATYIEVLNFLPPALGYSSAPTGAAGGVGTVLEVDTLAPILGGPITEQGTISLQTPLGVNYGGTGATTPAAALTNLGGFPMPPGGVLPVAQGGTNNGAFTPGLLIIGAAGPALTSLTTPVTTILGGTGTATFGPTPLFGGYNILTGRQNAAVVPSADYSIDDTVGALYATFAATPAVAGDPTGPGLYLTQARNTIANPGNTQAGDNIGLLAAAGYGATAWAQSTGMVVFQATEPFSDAQQGTEVAIIATPNGQSGENAAVVAMFQEGVVVGNPGLADQGAGTVTAAGFSSVSYGTGGSGYASFKFNGSISAPLPVAQFDWLGWEDYFGYTGAGISLYAAAHAVVAPTAWTAGSQQTQHVFMTTPQNSTAAGVRQVAGIGNGLMVGAETLPDPGLGNVNISGTYQINGVPHVAALGTKLSTEEKIALFEGAMTRDAAGQLPAIPLEIGMTGLVILCITDAEGLQFQDVTLGPPDSGGPGFRALRVPN
jgi:hypothetical protein